MIRRRPKDPPPAPALPLAPMVDCVFLLLLYFVWTASLKPPDESLALPLPGTAPLDGPLVFPDVVVLELRADGAVALQGLPVAAGPARAPLQPLAARLARLRAAAEGHGAELALTIAPDPAATHEALVAVLDAAAQAGVTRLRLQPPD